MDRDKIQRGVKLILEGIGEDPGRPGLLDTPRRVADAYEEIFAGIEMDPASVMQKFHSEHYDEIVLVKDIPFYSVCEHHLLPFIGKAHVAYLPSGNRITGLSKLARIVDIHSRRLQLQERLTSQIADTIMKAIEPMGVMVVISAEHLCMTMRGIKKPGSATVTSVVRGVFRENAATRAETMALIEGTR
jgi:GTP cyclohydrolase I